MQPLSLGRVLLILLPGVPIGLQPRLDDDGNPLPRARSLERHRLGEPRVRACRVTRVWGDSCCNVTVDLDGGNDAKTPEDVRVLNDHGFEVVLNGLLATKLSCSLTEGELVSIGQVRYPPFVAAKPVDRKPSLVDARQLERRVELEASAASVAPRRATLSDVDKDMGFTPRTGDARLAHEKTDTPTPVEGTRLPKPEDMLGAADQFGGTDEGSHYDRPR